MATMNISLPDSLKGFIQDRMTQSEFSNVSDYIRALIRQDREIYLQKNLEQLLLEGMESGKSEPVNEQFWNDLQRHVTK